MKIIMFISMLALGVPHAVAGEAPVLHSTIQKIVSRQSPELIGNPNVGIMTVDERQNEIRIDFYLDPCGQVGNGADDHRMKCQAAPERVSSYQVKLESIIAGPCDTVIYQGSLRTETQTVNLQVSDNKSFYKNCKSIIAVSPMRANLELQMSDGFSASYDLRGTELK